MTQEVLAGVDLATKIAQELKIKVSQALSAINMLDDGASVPFIARYRKDATSGLDNTQLRSLVERLYCLRELEQKRSAILENILSQNKLSAELEQAIMNADDKVFLEDLYLPYRLKRRTKAHLAKEAGLESLAHALWHDKSLVPVAHALLFINVDAGINDADAALEGARQILIEKFSEDAHLLNDLRSDLWKHAVLSSSGMPLKKKSLDKFSKYLSYRELIHKISSHHALALIRGRRENILKLEIVIENNEAYGEQLISKHFGLSPELCPADGWLMDIVHSVWKIKLLPKLSLELLGRLRDLADMEAIEYFARNLRDLLLQAPAGAKTILGLDPAIHTGVKAVVVDANANLLDCMVLPVFSMRDERYNAIVALAKFSAKHHVNIISIGNGAGAYETERLVIDTIRMYPDLKLSKVMISEAGAHAYAGSELAAREAPELDISFRAALSIARRLQDPLVELAKIDPRAINVAQYQYDINGARLARALRAVVEDCVNLIGVDVNTASAELLAHVSGIDVELAKNLVSYRDKHGAFASRESLKKVVGMDYKVFLQAAGFLRIIHGDSPLDAFAIHPESYALVEKILEDHKLNIIDVIANPDLIKGITANIYVDEQYSLHAISDISQELMQPSYDLRPEFKTVRFRTDIRDITDLCLGMVLEGTVNRIVNFGVFVDIGVYQDALLHVSAMSVKAFANSRIGLKSGDILELKVVELDIERKRIGVSMILSGVKIAQESHRKSSSVSTILNNAEPSTLAHSAKIIVAKKSTAPAAKKMIFNTAMADALIKLKCEIK